MKKKNARQPKPTSANQRRNFIATENARHLWVLAALELRPMSREELDQRIGCSAPELVADLRVMGFDIPCEPAPAFDPDDLRAGCDVYCLSPADRKRITRRLRARSGA
ncbi:TPA: hypothetical protein QDC03_007301 [Burkholderia cepacia]|uniref:hypothetical protein n=1 Tax=Burkholderia cepacia TaxID=292 RepID=UPI0011B24C59|nr:hypothetical protein [Burkholderia cepacia]HDR9512055.1 hypothetical protein [Burkholderia cepacia]